MISIGKWLNNDLQDHSVSHKMDSIYLICNNASCEGKCLVEYKDEGSKHSKFQTIKIVTPTLVTKSKSLNLTNLRRLTIIIYMLIKMGEKVTLML